MPMSGICDMRTAEEHIECWCGAKRAFGFLVIGDGLVGWGKSRIQMADAEILLLSLI